MKISNLPLDQLHEASWNPNRMDEATFNRLKNSILRFGVVQNLVVRPIDGENYEVLSGNHRLQILKEAGISPVPCYVIDLDDSLAQLLAQALNHIHGEDNLGLRAEVVRSLLKTMTQEEILAILPDTKLNLAGLANLGQDTIANYLQNWDKARATRLRNLQFRLTQSELEVVEKALQLFMAEADRMSGNNPNTRGKALYLLCNKFLERRNDEQDE